MSEERIVIVRHLSQHEAEVLEFFVDNYPCEACGKGEFEYAAVRTLTNVEMPVEVISLRKQLDALQCSHEDAGAIAYAFYDMLQDFYA
jgi:hypothetical protein